MAYGTIKVDTITFTDSGVDKSVSISGLVQNPTFSGNITVTGTVSGNTIQGQTVSGVTVTGTTANFTSGNFTTFTGGTITLTSGVIASGTAANPSLSILGDANTGLYSPGADQLAISTSGAQRLVVDASGNVGVGVTPSELLHVNGSAIVKDRLLLQRLQSSDNLSVLTFSDTLSGSKGNNLSLGTPGGHDLLFHTGGTEKVRITSAGLVGVGTSSPSELLELSATTDPKIQFTDVGNVISKIGISASTALTFEHNGAERVRIDASGRVGVGTTSPAVALDVYGAINLRSQYNLTWGGAFGANIPTIVGDSSVPYLAIYPAGSTSGEKLRIDSSGRVGIGTSSPYDSSRLTIVPASTPQSVSDVNIQLRIGEASSNADYGLSIGYGFISGSGWFSVLQSKDNNGGRHLLLNPSGGNVGIGTTGPQALLHVSGTNAFALFTNSNTGSAATDGLQIGMGGGGSTEAYIIQQENNNLHLYNAGATAATVFSTNSAERARLTSSGQLLVGTSSSAGNGSSIQAIGPNAVEVFRYSAPTGNSGPSISLTRSASNTVGTVAAVAATDDLGQVSFRGAGNGTTFLEGATIRATVESGTISGSSLPSRLSFSTTSDGSSSPTERVRITNGGLFKASDDGTYVNSAGGYHEFSNNASSGLIAYFRNKGASSPLGVQITYSAASPNNTASEFLYCSDSTAQRASIRSNGGIANYSANNANLSDRNTKKDITPAANTWDCIKDWEIVNYRYKDQPDDADLNLGVIAQQVAESCPEVITVFEEAKDDQPEKLGVKEQQMYWMAIKALQEAQVRIEALEAKVVALESKP